MIGVLQMPFYEREDKILKLLSSGSEFGLHELAESLFISLPTLRRDLIKLEKKGLITRGHGKVSLKLQSADTTIPFILRIDEKNSVKNVIAQKATKHIKDGFVIMLDGSTSAYHLVPYLAEFKNLIVITGGAKTALLLAHYGITTIGTGGFMLNHSFSYVGKDALNTIEKYNADVLFFSCRGISYDGKLTDNSIEENVVRRQMMQYAKKKVFLCDSSKFGKTCLHNLCTLSEIDDIVSEASIPDALKI